MTFETPLENRGEAAVVVSRGANRSAGGEPTTNQRRAIWLARLGLAALAIAFGGYAWLFANYWTLKLARDTAGWAVGVALVAAFLRLYWPEHARSALLAAVAVYFAIGAGLVESAAVALFFLASREIGVFALKALGARARNGPEFSRPFLIGMALYLALLGAMVHGGFNSAALYLVLLIAPFLARLAFPHSASPWRSEWEAMARAGARLERLPYAPFAVAVIVIGFVARFAFLPTVGADENAFHLSRWTELQNLHRFNFHLDSNIWADAPFATDLMHAAISLVASADARTALNLALFALLLRQIWAVAARCGLIDRDRLLVLMLFASTPMIGFLLGTLQTETVLALVTAMAARACLAARQDEGFDIGDAAWVAAAAALAAATKVNAMVIGACFVGVAATRFWTIAKREDFVRASRRWPVILALVAVLLYLALHSYILAWRATHNPFFPLLGKLFCSHKYPCQDIVDTRWQHGFGLGSFVSMFLHTSRYGELKDLTAGSQYLILLPFGLAFLLRRVAFLDAIVIAAPLLIFGAAMFSQVQYLRYLFPVAPLASLAMSALLIRRTGARSALATAASRAAMRLCISVNLIVFPGISWIFIEGPQAWYTPAGREEAERNYAPVKLLTERLNQRAAGLRVLYPIDQPYGASLRGAPIYVNWYAPKHKQRFNAIADDAGVAAFLADEQIDYAIVSPIVSPRAPERRLAEFLALNARPEMDVTGYVAFRVGDQPVAYHEVYSAASAASALPLIATPEWKVVATVRTGGAGAARYRVDYRCASGEGWFIAQVNWDVGPPFYRLVPCSSEGRSYVGAAPIPAGARKGDIYISTRDAALAEVSRLTLDLD